MQPEAHVCSFFGVRDRSGVYCALGRDTGSYADQAYENDMAVGAIVEPLLDPKAIRSVFPSSAKVSVPDGAKGYINRDGGWAFASQGIQRMMDNVTSLGGKIIPGKAVSELTRSNGRVSAVRCTDGSVYDADFVVLATGSWSASAFPDLGLSTKCLATGYVLDASGLTQEYALI